MGVIHCWQSLTSRFTYRSDKLHRRDKTAHIIDGNNTPLNKLSAPEHLPAHGFRKISNSMRHWREDVYFYFHPPSVAVEQAIKLSPHASGRRRWPLPEPGRLQWIIVSKCAFYDDRDPGPPAAMGIIKSQSFRYCYDGGDYSSYLPVIIHNQSAISLKVRKCNPGLVSTQPLSG